MAAKTIHKLKQAEAVALADIVRQHCKQINGYAVYNDGWDDLRVQQTTPFPCTVANVQGMRKALVGNLAPAVKPLHPDVATWADRVERLEKSLAELQKWAGGRKFDKFPQPE